MSNFAIALIVGYVFITTLLVAALMIGLRLNPHARQQTLVAFAVVDGAITMGFLFFFLQALGVF